MLWQREGLITSLTRIQGWNNPAGDEFFARQRRKADIASASSTNAYARGQAEFFYSLMQRIAKEFNDATGALCMPSRSPPNETQILDMCMAPGGFLDVATKLNPSSSATAFSLPVTDGGHDVLLIPSANISIKMLDVTMLAADMGAQRIPDTYPDPQNFLPKQLPDGPLFDLVMCDGVILRTHDRPSHRESGEGMRLMKVQLALGLEHVKPNGTMIVLLHGVAAIPNVKLLRQFSDFSTLRLFKPKTGHAKRSSFYMIATDIQIDHPSVAKAIAEFKQEWYIATFGTDEEVAKMKITDKAAVEKLLDEFGSELIRLGKEVWAVQAEALAKAPFIKDDGAGASDQRENARPEPQRPGRWVRGGGKWRLRAEHQRT